MNGHTKFSDEKKIKKEDSEYFLFLAMYPMEPENRAATVRIRALKNEFGKLIPPERLIFISGTMNKRRVPLIKFIFSNIRHKIENVYVEAHSTCCTELEIFLLWMLKKQGANIIIYIRDAYPLFKEFNRPGNLKDILYKIVFLISNLVYRMTANKLGFPSQGLADAIKFDKTRKILLPPGLNSFDVPPAPMDGAFLLVGSSTSTNYGSDIFRELARHFPDNRFIWCVCSRDSKETKKWDLPSNFIIKNWDRNEIANNLGGIKAFVLPRRTTPYMNLTIPIKLMDYLAWRRPVLATKCTEIARILRESGMGILCDDKVESFCNGVNTINKMNRENFDKFYDNGKTAAPKYSWENAARRILQAFPAYA